MPTRTQRNASMSEACENGPLGNVLVSTSYPNRAEKRRLFRAAKHEARLKAAAFAKKVGA
jgi:hypothetical protein